MKKLLITGDPAGTHTKRSLSNGFSPEDIIVWETEEKHIYTIDSINANIDTIFDKDKELTNLKSFLEYNNMQDLISVGNPPYTKNSSTKGAKNGGSCKDLDYPIYELLMKHSRYVSQIVRTKFSAKMSSAFRRRLFSTGKVVSIIALPEETFPTISLTPTCILTWSLDHIGPTKVVYLDGTEKFIFLDGNTCIKLDNPDFVAEVSNNIAYRHERGEYDLNELKSGNCPMIETMGGFKATEPKLIWVDSTQHNSCVNQHGVIMNDKYGGSTKSFGPIYVKEYEHSISGSAVCLKTNSLEESKRLRDYLLSEDVQSLVRLNKISNVNSKELFKTIPDMTYE